jgi:hypothetical protein
MEGDFVDVELWVIGVFPDIHRFDVGDEVLPGEEDGDFAAGRQGLVRALGAEFEGEIFGREADKYIVSSIWVMRFGQCLTWAACSSFGLECVLRASLAVLEARRTFNLL